MAPPSLAARAIPATSATAPPTPPPATPAAAAPARPTLNLAAAAFIPTAARRPAAAAWRRDHRLSFTAAAAAPAPAASRRGLATAAEDVANAQDAAARVAEGRLVEFKVTTGAAAGTHVLGLVLRPSSKSSDSWEIEDAAGILRTVKERDVAYVLPSAGGDGSAAALASTAAEAEARAREAAAEGCVALAWEVSEPGALYTVEEMADLVFAATTPAVFAAAHRLLLSDRLHFKQVGRRPPLYAARSAADVESLRVAAQKAREEEEALAAFAAAATEARALPRRQRPTAAAWRNGPHAARVAAVEAFALGRVPPAGDAGRGAAGALAAAGALRTPQGAAALLQAIGFWPPHAQLPLLSAGLTEEFSSALEAEATSLASTPPPDPDAAHRRDLTALHVVTIDDESTTEIDDGLSAEILTMDESSSYSSSGDGSGTAVSGNYVRVWVHVADPSRWVSPGDPLAAEAARRSKTLYLPTGMVPMFPLSLATGPFSLRQGERCCALSVSCVVAPDGEVVPGSVEVTPTEIVPTVRLTYDIADEMLDECGPEDEPALHALAAVAAARRRRRATAGAVEIAMPETKMAVADPLDETPAISIAAAAVEDSSSRQLVAELMILAGEACARAGAALGVPLPYRGQADPILPSDEELESIPEGPCRMAALRSAMTRSVTVADAPQRHAGLGLNGYVQVTSPIRRYGDLLAHWQLKAALRGETPPMDVREMSAAIAALAAATQRSSKLERDAQSYWIAYYFKNAVSRDPGTTWEAVCLGWFKQEAGLARVLLEDLGLETLVKVARPAKPGTRFRVRCSSADPLAGMYRLDEAMGTGSSSSDGGGDSTNSE